MKTNLWIYHRQYNFDFDDRPKNMEDAVEYLNKHKNKIIALPVWGYDHGGIVFKAGERTYPFNCQWDSGRAGTVWAWKGADGLTDDEIRQHLIDRVADFNNEGDENDDEY